MSLKDILDELKEAPLPESDSDQNANNNHILDSLSITKQTNLKSFVAKTKTTDKQTEATDTKKSKRSISSPVKMPQSWLRKDKHEEEEQKDLSDNFLDSSESSSEEQIKVAKTQKRGNLKRQQQNLIDGKSK